MGQGQFGIDPDAVDGLAGEIAAAKAQGHELCLVVGGGNIFRGMAAAAKGFDRASADYMGMLATVMNALALQNALEKFGVDTRVQSAIPMASVSRALHPPPRAAAHREGPDRPVRRRHRQSLFHDRHCRRAARRRDGLRRPVQGHQRRRRLHRRPEEGRRRHALRHAELRQGAERRPQGDGRRRGRAVPRQQYSDRRLQHPPAGQPCRGAGREAGPRRSFRTGSEQ